MEKQVTWVSGMSHSYLTHPFTILELCKDMQREIVGRTFIVYEIERTSFSFLTRRYIQFQEIGGATVC